MVFPTVEFAIFFLLVAAVAWSTVSSHRAHKALLLAASYLFYAFWDVRFLPLLFGMSAIAWLVARLTAASVTPRSRKLLFATGIAAILVTLGYFKYTGFLVRTMAPLLESLGLDTHHAPSPILPLGISFIAFHAISLMVDAWRRKLDSPPTLIDALLYVSFFPQLVAGPILRAAQFLPQLARAPDPQRIAISEGLVLIVLGLFKKVVLADYLAAQLVDPFYADPVAFSGLEAWLAIYGYAAQIYCDFSGYTDIATGCALLLGYHFPDNFNRPYLAASPQEFWRRWHISLSSWLRDYLYIPLGGSRAGTTRLIAALFLTMLLGGLWHGAAWTFVAWGAYHGLLLAGHRLWRLWRPRQDELRGAMLACARFVTFHLVCFGWILFRSGEFATASLVGERLLSGTFPAALPEWPAVAAIALGIGGQYLPEHWFTAARRGVQSLTPVLRGACAGTCVMLIEAAGPVGIAPFIYFQF